MKDNDLLILLLIIIVVGIIYYIYKCFCNNKKIKEKFNKTSSKSSNKSNEKFETPPQPPPISCQLEFLNYSELPFSIKHKNTNSYLSIGPICFLNSGITEPEESKTFPNLTIEKRVWFCSFDKA